MTQLKAKPSPAIVRKLRDDESGATGIIFGLSLIPAMLMVGAAIDYTRYETMRSALHDATDTAALSVASHLSATTTITQATAQAKNIINAQPKLSSATVSPAVIPADLSKVCITSQITVESSFMKLAHVGSGSPAVTSCAATAAGVDPNTTYEIALVVDNSGSMTETTNSTTKIAALKTAANSFVNTMFTKAPNRVKFSVTPFSGAVVAVDPTVASNRTLSWIDVNGNNSQHWVAFGGKTAATTAGFTSRYDIFTKLKQRNSSMDWRGCFEALAYPKNVQDVTISTGDAETLFVPYLAPDEPSGYSNNNYIDDNGGVSTKNAFNQTVTTYTCSDTASGDWNKLSHVCKYKPTAAKSGSYGPTAFFGPSAFCPDNTTQSIMQLTSTQATVTTKINQLVANGNTNLHEGFMWGWRSISPVGPFAAGQSYSAPVNRKIMVFMTDGYNNWGAYPGTVVGSDYESLGYYTYNGQKNGRLPNGTAGDMVNYQQSLTAASGSNSSFLSTSRLAEDDLTSQACENAKAAGIEVFTIGFSIPTDPIDAQGLDLLKSCATNPDHYFAVQDVAQLNAAFSSIGVGLGKLHLTQ